MKTPVALILTALAVFLTACRTVRIDPAPPAVSTAAVAQGIQSADDSAAGAQTSVAAAEGHVDAFRTRAQRIDDKAAVILNFWDQAR